MKSASQTRTGESRTESLGAYVTTVNELVAKLDRIFAHHRETADSLARAAAALRSIAEHRKGRTLAARIEDFA